MLPAWLLEETAAVLGPKLVLGKNDYTKTRIPERRGQYDSNLLDQLRENFFWNLPYSAPSRWLLTLK